MTRTRAMRMVWVLAATLSVAVLLGTWRLSQRYLLGVNASFSMPEPALFLVDRAAEVGVAVPP